MSTISIIGAGGMAAATGSLAVKAGHLVEVTARDAAKADTLAKKLGAGARVGTFGAVPTGEVVILALPYAVVLDVVKHYGAKLSYRNAGRYREGRLENDPLFGSRAQAVHWRLGRPRGLPSRSGQSVWRNKRGRLLIV